MFDDLNSHQWKAARHTEGPLLVLAGAGSGKTRIVTYRIAHLIQNGVSPYAILALTFTNKAAGEMRERVQRLTEHSVLIATFHSLGARILRESIEVLGYTREFIIYDAEDSEKLIKACLSELNIKDKALAPKAFAQLISQAKNQMLMPEDVKTDSSSSTAEILLPQVYERYARKLKESNAVDFDDLLFLTVHLFSTQPEVLEKYQARWPYLLIDEYQDTNHAQYLLAQLLVQKSQNLFVVGDPDQSIYSWRGANIRNILDFQTDYPSAQIVRLEQNYRSRCNILNAANALISRNKNRLEKRLWSDRGDGDKLLFYAADDERMEAEFVAGQIAQHAERNGTRLSDIVIFYRTNFQSRVLEDALLRRRLPYIVIGGVSFYQRREVKDILAFLRLIHSPSDYISFVRTINLPKRGIGLSTIDKICSAATLQQRPVLEYCRDLLAGTETLLGGRLGGKQREGLQEYVALLGELTLFAKQASLRELVVETISRTGYLGYLRQDADTFEERKENIDELISTASEWELIAEDPSLTAFLEELSLKTSVEETNRPEDSVHLMTLHNGKGLEFEVAFLVGMEEDLLPHANCRGSFEALEEERRLCYVGMTRAKEYLYMTAAQTRFLWGMYKSMRPSRFLGEVPKDYFRRVYFGHQVVPPSSR